tara:strand:- start:4613 stop:4897 length:285 start_codon:yes stop_codon:yes gene_type:complete
VDLEEVPEKSTALLQEAVEELEFANNLINDLKYKIENKLANKERISSEMDEIRKTLGKVDSKIVDTNMIMTGFYDAMAHIDSEPNREKEQINVD